MRPPPKRAPTGKCVQVRPVRGGNPGKVPANLRIVTHQENKDGPMTRAVQRRHEHNATPLMTIQRYKETNPHGDFAKHAFHPFLQTRSRVDGKVLVTTYAY